MLFVAIMIGVAAVIILYFAKKNDNGDTEFNQIINTGLTEKGETFLTRKIRKFKFKWRRRKYSLQMTKRMILFALTHTSVKMRFGRLDPQLCPICGNCIMFMVTSPVYIYDDNFHIKCMADVLVTFVSRRYLLMNEICYNRDVTLRTIHLLIQQLVVNDQ